MILLLPLQFFKENILEGLVQTIIVNLGESLMGLGQWKNLLYPLPPEGFKLKNLYRLLQGQCPFS